MLYRHLGRHRLAQLCSDMAPPFSEQSCASNTLVFIAASWTTSAQLIAGLFQRKLQHVRRVFKDTAALTALKSMNDIAALLFVRN
jgi:hypothetical protein